MAEEKILNLNLRKQSLQVAKWRRSKDLTQLLKQVLKKKLKSDKIKIEKKLNEAIWKRGMENPPTKLRLKTVKQEDGTIKIDLKE
jgi:large subunit ribosomal protein L31e